MSSTINASTASGGGIVTTADASGVLALQTAGVTGLTIDASQKVTFANSLTSPTLVTPTISGAVMNTMASSILTSGTSQSASGATVSFTGIPSWAKRITVLLVGVTTVGSGIPAIRAGTGSYEATGYLGATVKVGSANTTDGGASATTSWDIVNSASSAYTYAGQLVITKFSGNQYIISGLLQYSSNSGLIVNGVKTFSGPITQLQLQMQTGTDTFNAGSINIMYE